VLPHQIPDRSRPVQLAELDQLASNPRVTLVGILLRQSEDELPALSIDRRSTGTKAAPKRSPFPPGPEPDASHHGFRPH
jgi:hypothetical protein